MSNTDVLKDLLKKQYDKLIGDRVETEKILNHKHKMFHQNTQDIEKLTQAQLESFEVHYKTMIEAHEATLKQLESDHKNNLSDLKKRKQNTQKDYQKDKQSNIEALEKKQTLNELKAQKIDTEYQIALDKFAEEAKAKRQKYDKTIETATQTFYEKTVELEKDTDIKIDTLDNQRKEKLLAFSSDIDKTNAETEKKLAEEDKRLKASISEFKTTLKNLKNEFTEGLKPHDETIKKTEAKHAKALKEETEKYDALIAKKTKYKNEKEKINDNAEANRYAKEVKQHTKEKKEALDTLTEEHKLELDPLKKERLNYIETYEKKFIDTKRAGIDTIKNHLIRNNSTKTDDFIKSNTTNIESLKYEAKLNHEKEMVLIDNDIQVINFNQTLEEARLLYEKDSNIITPDTGLKTEEEKRKFNLAKNALNTKRNIETAEHDKNQKAREIQHDKDQALLDSETLKAKHNFDYNHQAQTIENTIERYEQDEAKEHFLITHYYTHAKNYTALKNDGILAHKKSVIKAIETHKNTQIKDYEAMMKQAETDHDIIMEQIDQTYQREILIYQNALKEIENNHQVIINSLVSEQAKERNKDLSLIEELDAKKDKNRIKKLKKNLNQKQENHDEAVAIKTRELEQKQKLYTNIIENIKAFKIQSIEEAETLLMHIKDQIQAAINRIEKTATNDINTFDTLYYEIKHSADLFNTFQLQRKSDTLEKTNTYKKTRIQRKEIERASYKTKLEERLQHVETTFHEKLEMLNEALDQYKIDIEARLDTIEKTDASNTEKIERAYQEETQKLNNLIQKEKRNYEQKLKHLSQEKKAEKEACFKRKDNSEKNYEDTLERHTKENQKYIEERKNILEEDKKRFSKNVDKLVKAFETSPIKHFNEKHINDTPQIIEGSIEVPTFEDK